MAAGDLFFLRDGFLYEHKIYRCPRGVYLLLLSLTLGFISSVFYGDVCARIEIYTVRIPLVYVFVHRPLCVIAYYYTMLSISNVLDWSRLSCVHSTAVENTLFQGTGGGGGRMRGDLSKRKKDYHRHLTLRVSSRSLYCFRSTKF